MAAGLTEPPYTRDILRLAGDVPYRTGFDFEGAERVSRTCGSRAKVAVTLDDEGRVASIRHAVEACAYGQAAAAVMAAGATGKSGAEIEQAVAMIAAWLDGAADDASTIWNGLDALEPGRSRRGRHGAILLPFQTLSDAVKDARR